MKTYVCECGKTFDNPQGFNGHKANCVVHAEKVNKPFYQSSRDPKVREKIRLSFIHNAEAKKRTKLDTWIAEQHTCEKCGKIMTEFYGSGRFCSRVCANSRQHSFETKLKIKASVKQYMTNNEPVINSIVKRPCDKINHEAAVAKYTAAPKYCQNCGKLLSFEKRFRKYCSAECVSAGHSNSLKLAHTEGRHPGWKTAKPVRSYPEQIWAKLLQDNNILYEEQVPVLNNTHHYYFLDFKIGMIDLEIDGRQHKDRLIEDMNRTQFLETLGYTVYRIVWNKDWTIINEQLTAFLDFYSKRN